MMGKGEEGVNVTNSESGSSQAQGVHHSPHGSHGACTAVKPDGSQNGFYRLRHDAVRHDAPSRRIVMDTSVKAMSPSALGQVGITANSGNLIVPNFYSA